jgi:hypothetical protein
VAIDGAFRDNMHDILDYCLNNPEIRKIVGDDPNLSLTQDNVEKFLHRCLIFNAQDCLKVLLKHMKEVKTELKVNYAILIARAVTVYNHHRKDLEAAETDDSSPDVKNKFDDSQLDVILALVGETTEACEQVIAGVLLSKNYDPA